MNPRQKYLYHQKLIGVLADAYTDEKLHKILAKYFTSNVDPTLYSDKRQFLEAQIERLDDTTIDTIARDHGMVPEIEALIMDIVSTKHVSATKPKEKSKENEKEIHMTRKQRLDICSKLINILSSSSYKQVESLLLGYGLTRGHNSDWGVLADYIENVLVEADDKAIIKMEEDYNLGILNPPKTTMKTLKNESGNNAYSAGKRGIFISHSSQDKKVVEKLIAYIRAIGVNHRDIFCTSFEGYGIPLGDNFLERIKNEITGNTLVIFVLSPNFYSSAVSLCEMGATWINTKEHIPVLIPPFDFPDVKGVIPLTQGMKINDKEKLNSLKKKLESFLSLDPIDFSIWERDRDKIFSEANEILVNYSSQNKSIDENFTDAPTNTQSAQVKKFLEKVELAVKESNIEVRKISYKVSRPILEGASLENDPVVQQMWINLYLNYVDASVQSINEALPLVLNELSTNEVKLLKYMHDNDTGINVNQRMEGLIYEQHEVNNLSRKGLIELDKRFTYNRETTDEVNHGPTGIITISPFGKDLIRACSR